MTSAIRRKQFDRQPPPREWRKWYDWPLTILLLVVVGALVLPVVVVKPYMRRTRPRWCSPGAGRPARRQHAGSEMGLAHAARRA